MGEGLLVNAFNDKLVPMHECYLQGSILDSQRDALLHRLKGLCDYVTEAHEHFHDHELVYQIASMANAPATTYRIRRSLDQEGLPWNIRYVGPVDGAADKNWQTLLRQSHNCAVTSNIETFLQELGFRLDHEFSIRGFLFRKGRMKVTVAKLFKVLPDKSSDPEPLSNSCLVELSVIETHIGHQKIDEEIRHFADQLKPLVQLEKVDASRIRAANER